MQQARLTGQTLFARPFSLSWCERVKYALKNAFELTRPFVDQLRHDGESVEFCRVMHGRESVLVKGVKFGFFPPARKF